MPTQAGSPPLTGYSKAPSFQLLRVAHSGGAAGSWHCRVELVAHAHMAERVLRRFAACAAVVVPEQANLAVEPGAAAGRH